MHRMIKSILAFFAALFLVVSLAACTSDGKSTSAEKESTSRDGSYNAQVKNQPAHSMAYSPTRETINKWIDTWGKKGAVSYVYLQNSNGDLLGYYVLKGLPVSYCVGLTPPYSKTQLDVGQYQGQAIVPAPSVDGAFYSGSACNTYFGFDAETGAYIEYTAGLGINVLLYNQPLPQTNNVPNLSPSH